MSTFKSRRLVVRQDQELGLTVVDLVKDPNASGSLTRSTTLTLRFDKALGLVSFALAAFFIALSQSSFADSPAGVFRGEWRSGSTGHHGPMRAVVQPRTDGTYQARFTGRFALIIPFAYKVTLQPTQDAYGNTYLTAEKPLGPLLGSYRMSAQANQYGLTGNFQAAGDTGSIQMKRLR